MKKSKTICIICNGMIRDRTFHKKIIKKADMIICADGGANICARLNIVPDYIVGDMDSIKKSVLKKFGNNKKTTVIIDKDQNITDLELAIKLANSKKPQHVNLLGMIGDRFDHTLANIYSMSKFNKNIQTKIIDPIQEITVLDKNMTIKGNIGDTVSLIALTNLKGLSYKGLKWKMNNKNVSSGWFGISNIMVKNKGEISVKSGRAIVIKMPKGSLK